MTIRLEVTGETVEEFKQQFGQVLGVFVPFLTGSRQAPKETATASGGEPKETARSEKPKPVKDAAKKETPPKDDAPSLDDLRAKLQTLGTEKSHDAVYEVLKQFGAKKASEVAEDKRAEVIEAIDAKLKEAA